jgi:flagellar biosynthesis anti-sigma factor FlgM
MNVINEINGLRTMMPPQPNEAAGGPQRESGATDDETRESDTVELSAEGAALAESKESADNEGTRVARIARIRAEIQNGTYDVNGKLDHILERLLEDLH